MNRTPLILPSLALILLSACSEKATEDPNVNPYGNQSSGYIDPALSSAIIDPGFSFPAYSSAFIDPGISLPAYSSAFIDPGISYPAYSSSIIPGLSSTILPYSSAIVAPSSSSLFVQSSSSVDPGTLACGGKMPPPITGGQNGYATRYWDCCKPSCSWPENTINKTPPPPNGISKNCSINNSEMECYKDVGWLQGTKSGCDAGGEAYTCYSQAPYTVCDKLAYGYAAVAGNSPMCGHCFQLQFDGKNKDGFTKASHRALLGKTMIVMASNIGYDVGSGHFDIMIPGGGVGAFAGGCGVQWGVDVNNETLVGAKYGGLLTQCQKEINNYDAPLSQFKTCVKNKCNALFGSKPALAELLEGCNWFADWFETADNPSFTYQEVDCPAELVQGYRSTFH